MRAIEGKLNIVVWSCSMQKKYFLFIQFFLFVGCGSSSRDGLPTVDVFKKYPEKEIIIQHIADIEYVQLETTPNVLLAGRGQRVFFVSEQYILAINRVQGDVFVFSRNGKIISHFNHTGRGPFEYIVIHDIIFDEQYGEIYVFNNSTNLILVYSITGDCIRTIKYPSSNLRLNGYNFDDETLLVYDDYGVRLNRFREKPYMLLSKKDGSIDTVINITMPVRNSNSIIVDVDVAGKDNLSQILYINTPNNRYGGKDFVIGDISSDTIYWLKKNKKQIPFITRIPSVHDTDPKISFAPELTTDKFILLDVTTLNFKAITENKGSIQSSKLMYEFQTDRIYDITLRNEDFPTMEWEILSADVPENMAIILIDAFTLVEALKEKKLKGKLAQLATTLDEEDNPILMIVHFK